MTEAIIKYVSRILSPFWLFGPIFDKELRVSSRRRRNYVLRFAYIALLSTILYFFWSEFVQTSGYTLFQVSRLAVAGQIIISFIVWFQFCATQIIAVIMLSTAISDEIYNKTLGLLMTTPINSFQIVMGKLLSKLLQLILLLIISLPLLAIVRIFGGVPWNFIISGLCLTLATIIFIGSLSLFFSIFSQRAYVVIIETIVSLIVIFAVIPLVISAIYELMHWSREINENLFYAILLQPNSYIQMFFSTMKLLEPNISGIPFLSWQLNCGILTVASICILSISTILVRKIALRQATGQLIFTRAGKKSLSRASLRSEHSGSKTRSSDKREKYDAFMQEPFVKIREVKDPPVIWKELRMPMLGRHKIIAGICIFLVLTLLIFIYWLCARERALDDPDVHMMFVVVFLVLGMLFTIILTSTGITTEKESRSWPILLTTTLDDRQILFGKYVGTLRRLLPAWILLFAHIVIFSLNGMINPVAVIQIAILVAWIVTFLFCTGVYFSSRFKHTTTSVIVNLIFATAIWLFVPILLLMLEQFVRITDFQKYAETYMDANPFLHAVVIINANTSAAGENYGWVFFNANAFTSTLWMLTCLAGYTFVGLVFAWRAKCRFRKDIF